MNRFKLNDRTPKLNNRPKQQHISEAEIESLIASGEVSYRNYDTGEVFPKPKPKSKSKAKPKAKSRAKITNQVPYIQRLKAMLEDGKVHSVAELCDGKSRQALSTYLVRLKKQGMAIKPIKENKRVVGYQMMGGWLYG